MSTRIISPILYPRWILDPCRMPGRWMHQHLSPAILQDRKQKALEVILPVLAECGPSQGIFACPVCVTGRMAYVSPGPERISVLCSDNCIKFNV